MSKSKVMCDMHAVNMSSKSIALHAMSAYSAVCNLFSLVFDPVDFKIRQGFAPN